MEDINCLIKDELEKINNTLSLITFENNHIYNETKEFLNGSSKKIRSVVTLLYLKMNNVNISDNVISLLSAGEIIHNASLLHDDVIDKSKTRRGITTIAEKFSPHISILMGDYLLSLAVKIIADINNKTVTDIILNCTKQMANAEINQYILRGKTPSKEEYINICKGKTASLFEAILMSSAVLSNINPYMAKEFSDNFGILFQIKNDISKNSLKSDKLNNIHTAYDIMGIEKTKILSDNYIKEIRSILEKSPDNVYRKGLESLADAI